MRRRAILIEEQFGIFRIKRGDEILGSASTLERALDKATLGQAPPNRVFEAAEVIEPLLGERREESELVTG